MLSKLYAWTMGLAGHKRSEGALGFISFIESSLFPIPPDVLLIPMILARRERAWRIAAICTVTSVLGGLFGYLIGYALWEQIGQPIVEFYGYAEKFGAFQSRYEEWGAWIVAFFGLTPFPYKVITIASGVVHLDLWTFIIASVISRGARFFIVAALLWKFGEPIRDFIERRLGLITIIFFVGLIGGFVAIKYMV
jgi:membrane protein YqaA with SNARE-associated domain